MADIDTAFIGGSGLYKMGNLTNVEELEIDTPFGSPSDKIVVGSLDNNTVAFLPRHGRGHVYSPTKIPTRANIYALKSIGIKRIISVSAVGSLHEAIHPLDIVIPDQIIDRTRRQPNTFFDDGIVAHVGFAHPFCQDLSTLLVTAAQSNNVNTHIGGTYVAMEGPQFSTRAESELYRSWGASIIGMTALPEAKLAREAELCYATIAMVTDYDCWHDSEEEVSVEMIIANLNKNSETAQMILRSLVGALGEKPDCICNSSLENSIVTRPDHIAENVKTRLKAIVEKYL